jgi:hypothetical protein
MLALAEARPDQAWLSSAEVEEGVAEEAWDEWAKARSAHPFPTDLPRVLHEAYTEASDGVRGMFKGVAEEAWLIERIRSFVEAFDVEEFLQG